MLSRSSLFNEMSGIFRRFDSLFRQMLDEPGWSTGQRLLPAGDVSSLWRADYPAVEVFTRDDQLVVRAELPGVDPGDVDISVTDNRLVIRGEKKEETKREEEDTYFQETFRGRFERSFALPEGAKVEEIQAAYKNGVLEITVPAPALPRARRIPIQGLPEAASGGKKTEAA